MDELMFKTGQALGPYRIVRVFDLTVDGKTGTAYYVMDLVLYKDGNPYTLDDVDRTSAGEDHLFIWFRDLCNALDYVHSQGVVHRDVKLGNILLNADKHVTLSDFGIAHIFGSGMVKASGRVFCGLGKGGFAPFLHFAPRPRLISARRFWYNLRV